MNVNELRSKTNAELAGVLDDSYQELFNLRFQKASGQMKSPSRIGEIRRQIARVKTILRERELAEMAI